LLGVTTADRRDGSHASPEPYDRLVAPAGAADGAFHCGGARLAPGRANRARRRRATVSARCQRLALVLADARISRPRTDYGWPPFQSQRPVPTPDDLRRLRGTGLDFIRLPVDPGPFLAADAAERASRLLDMLDAAVAATLDAGLGIIVNIQANAATHYWNPDRMVSSTAAPAFRSLSRAGRRACRQAGAVPARQGWRSSRSTNRRRPARRTSGRKFSSRF
jgi:hypothetical protein